MILLSLIGRLIVVGFALFVALMAGSAFVGFGLASGIFPELLSENGQVVFNSDTDRTILAGISLVIGFVASFQLANLALLPVTIAVAMTEMMRWQSLTAHLVLGGLSALFVMFSALSLPQGAIPSNGTITVSLSSGFVAAFFYWLIAGRNAGKWLSTLGDEDAHSECRKDPGK